MKEHTYVPLLAAMLTLSFLTACGGEAPEQDTTKVREVPASDSEAIEADLALCKTTIENVQNHDYISIMEENQLRGEDILNRTSTISFIKSGENLYRNTSIPQDGVMDEVPMWSQEFGILYADGVYYNNYEDGYSTTEDGDFQQHWGESTFSAERTAREFKFPWILEFDWDAQEIQHISTVNIGGQKAVRIQIMGAYLPDTICESYTAEFFFDQDAQLDRVEVIASYAQAPREGMDDYEAPTIDVTNTQRVLSTDEEKITKAIGKISKCALEDVKNKPDESKENEP